MCNVAVNWCINWSFVHKYVLFNYSDFRSLINFSVLPLALDAKIFVNNQNSVFTRASANGVFVWSSTLRRTQ